MKSDNETIDKKIVELRKESCRLPTIHRWLVQWDNFSQLDDIIVLIHILRVLDDFNLAVSRNEVRNCFNKFFKKDCHGDKKSYLNIIYKEFHIKNGTIVETAQSRDMTVVKRPVANIYDKKPTHTIEINSYLSKYTPLEKI